MKEIIILLFTFSLLGCPSYELPVSAKLSTPSYSIYAYPAFTCTIDDVDQICQDGAGWFYCNSADMLAYNFDTGGMVISSATQATVPCIPIVFQHADTVEDSRPVTPKP